MKPEQALHQAVAGYLAAVLPPEVVWTTIGHGGGGRVRGALLKSMGVLPGVPDIYLSWLRVDTYHGKWAHLPVIKEPETGWLELKSAKGKPSPAQRLFCERVLLLGHHHAYCRDLEGVAAALDAWKVPQRSHRLYASGALKLEHAW